VSPWAGRPARHATPAQVPSHWLVAVLSWLAPQLQGAHLPALEGQRRLPPRRETMPGLAPRRPASFEAAGPPRGRRPPPRTSARPHGPPSPRPTQVRCTYAHGDHELRTPEENAAQACRERSDAADPDAALALSLDEPPPSRAAPAGPAARLSTTSGRHHPLGLGPRGDVSPIALDAWDAAPVSVPRIGGMTTSSAGPRRADAARGGRAGPLAGGPRRPAEGGAGLHQRGAGFRDASDPDAHRPGPRGHAAVTSADLAALTAAAAAWVEGADAAPGTEEELRRLAACEDGELELVARADTHLRYIAAQDPQHFLVHVRALATKPPYRVAIAALALAGPTSPEEAGRRRRPARGGGPARASHGPRRGGHPGGGGGGGGGGFPRGGGRPRAPLPPSWDGGGRASGGFSPMAVPFGGPAGFGPGPHSPHWYPHFQGRHGGPPAAHFGPQPYGGAPVHAGGGPPPPRGALSYGPPRMYQPFPGADRHAPPASGDGFARGHADALDADAHRAPQPFAHGPQHDGWAPGPGYPHRGSPAAATEQAAARRPAGPVHGGDGGSGGGLYHLPDEPAHTGVDAITGAMGALSLGAGEAPPAGAPSMSAAAPPYEAHGHWDGQEQGLDLGLGSGALSDSLGGTFMPGMWGSEAVGLGLTADSADPGLR